MERSAASSWLVGFGRASLSLTLALSLSLPAVAFAAPPEASPASVQPAPAVAPQPDPAVQPQPSVQPQPAPVAQPSAGRPLYDPFAGQPESAPVAQPQHVPAPVVYPQPVEPAPPPVAAPRPRMKGKGLAIGGFSMFGAAYLFTVLGGAIAYDTGMPAVGRSLMIPVVGPFIGFANLDMDNDPSDAVALGTLGMVFSGIFQIGGLAMGFAGVGLMVRSHAERRYGARLGPGPGGLQLQF